MKLKLIIVFGITGIVLLVAFSIISTTNPTQQPDISQGGTNQTETKPQVGYLAPDFSLQTLDGKTVKLSDFRGKPVYINFWASWCDPCKEEIPALKDFYAKNKDKIVFLAVNITFQDKLADVQKTVAENNIEYPILLDMDGTQGAAMSYQITGVPEHFFIDSNGVIKARAIGAQKTSALEQYLSQAK